MTTGVFQYIDPATVTASDEPFLKPWAKVDTDATSYGRTERELTVANIRDFPADAFGTDVSGFALHQWPVGGAAVSPGDDDAAVRASYYGTVEAVLRAKLPGPRPVSQVVIFDHTIRQHSPDAPRQPVRQVHVDQTPEAAVARVRRHLPPGEADGLLAGRFQIVNVWRPIGHAATDFPLALIDWRTMAPDDLVRVDLLYPKRDRAATAGDAAPQDDDDRGKEVCPDPAKVLSTDGYEVRGETYGVVPNVAHRFHYVKDMTPDEVLFIKCFDSWAQPGHQDHNQPAIAALTPHTAFEDPATPPGTKGRQSIEVRCLVFYE